MEMVGYHYQNMIVLSFVYCSCLVVENYAIMSVEQLEIRI